VATPSTSKKKILVRPSKWPDLQFQLWGYAPAHTTTTPHDAPHATIPPRDDPPTRHNATTHVRRQLKDLSPPVCSLLSSKSRTCNVLHIAAFRLSSCSLIREITVSRWSLSRTQFSRYTIDTHTRASRCHVTPSSRSYKTLCPDEELDYAPSKRKTLNWTPFAWLNSSGHRTGFSTTEDFNKHRRKCFRTGHPSTDNNWDCPSWARSNITNARPNASLSTYSATT
jgi:hypothetical protein